MREQQRRDGTPGGMVRRTAAFVCSIALLVLIAACNEAPNEVGSELAPESVNATTISSLTVPLFTVDSTIHNPTFNYNQGFLYIGSTPTYKATTILRFTNLPDTLRTITAQQIESATLLMKPRRYVFGDSTANQLAFDVVRLTKPFVVNDTGNTIKFVPRWNDLFNTDGTPKPDYFSPLPIASFSGTIPLDSALPDLELPVNDEGKTLIAEWLRNFADSSKRQLVYGIGFVPKLTSTVVRQFSSNTLNQTLPNIRMRVFYRNAAGVRDSLLLVSGNDMTLADAPALPNEFFTVQSLVTRSARMYFDVSSIPKLNSILSARLILTVDTTRYRAGNIRPNNTDSATSHVVQLTYLSSRRTAGYLGRRQSGSDKIIFDNVPRVIEGALYDDNGKGYVTISPVNTVGCEQMAIYNFTADSTKRPKLIITHVSRPTFGGKK